MECRLLSSAMLPSLISHAAMHGIPLAFPLRGASEASLSEEPAGMCDGIAKAWRLQTVAKASRQRHGGVRLL
jgi:hypothetical protein